MADLPLSFTATTNWRGSLPREILCVFCRQHRLLEPTFSFLSFSESPSKALGSHKKLKVTDSAATETHCGNGSAISDGAKEEATKESSDMFRCRVTIWSKFQELVMECTPKQPFKKQSDSIQNASLQVLLLLDTYLKDLDVPVDKLETSASGLDIKFYPQSYAKAFALCRPIQYFSRRRGGEREEERPFDSEETSSGGHGRYSLDICGPDSGVSPSNGSLVCVSYTVSLLVDGSENVQEHLESNEEFEFEIGTGAILTQLEAAVVQMTVGQSAFLCSVLPPIEFVLATADDPESFLPLLTGEFLL